MSHNRSTTPSLKDAGWLKWPGTAAVFSALGGKGCDEIRAVGGAVRDTLLGREVSEVDFATTALPEEVMERAEIAGLKTVPTGVGHGTVTVVFEGKGFEVTTLRRDVATDGRRATVAYTDDWAEDARRRDFTLNALYAGADGALYDPLGVAGDIDARRVRFIGDARARVREDYLRILRYFRFHAELNSGDFDAEGLQACVGERSGLDTLSAERVRHELFRLLVAEGALTTLWTMYYHGLLVMVLGGVAVPARFERLAAIEAGTGARPDAVLRLAALAVMVEEDAARLSERLKLSNAEAERLDHAARHHGIAAATGEADAKRLLYRRGRSGARVAALMAWVVSGSAAADPAWRRLCGWLERLDEPRFPVQGGDIVALGVPGGPEVGAILKALEARWLEQDFAPGRDSLLKTARELVAER